MKTSKEIYLFTMLFCGIFLLCGCTQIVLVYIWMALPGSIRYHGPWNVLVPLSSCVLLWALAKLREPRVK